MFLWKMKKKRYRQGLVSALSCSMFWGIMPIYWHMLRPIESSVIIFYRIVLVAAVSLIAALFKFGIREILEPFRDLKLMLKYITAGILITANWSIYIWAVNDDRIIQTCIGYYIEPLMVCILGVLLFKDKLTMYKKTALGLAGAGVALIIIYFREIPLVALSLAVTFSAYAALKKNLSKPPVLSLLYETIFLAPFALAVVVHLETSGAGALAQADTYKYVLLMLCGLFTAIPLGLFADAANKISLFALGLSEYISPSISLIISIFLFKEPFEKVQLAAFAIIWAGLVFFSYGEYKEYRGCKEYKEYNTDKVGCEDGAKTSKKS